MISLKKVSLPLELITDAIPVPIAINAVRMAKMSQGKSNIGRLFL
jgi:hypothetical protein